MMNNMLVGNKTSWILGIMLALTAGLGSVSHAAPQEDDLCGNLKIMAENAMQSRQAGAPKSQLMNATQSARYPDYWQNAMKSVIEKAYEQPRYQDESQQQQAVRKYGEAVKSTCSKQS